MLNADRIRVKQVTIVFILFFIATIYLCVLFIELLKVDI